MHDLDILFINPPSRLEVYQKLAGKYAAIEPPTWALLLAQSVRSDGYNVKIMDSNAENLDEKEITKRRSNKFSSKIKTREKMKIKDFNHSKSCFFKEYHLPN